jgi:hypothetical protein
MSDEVSKATLQPSLSARVQNDDLAGASILTLLRRSADMAEGNAQYEWTSPKIYRLDLSRARPS